MRAFKKISAAVIVLILSSCGIRKAQKHIPDLGQTPLQVPVVVHDNDSTAHFEDNFVIKNKWKTYELYNTGNHLQLGYNNGALTQPLLQKQEKIFFGQVEKFVPSKLKQNLLQKLLKLYTRKMYLNVRNEDQQELYGISRYSSDEYDHIAPKFQRAMYLHAAHDIGHAMQDLMLVGCSSMAVWGNKSENGKLLIGRVFDFYAGDAFAQQKMISFIKPEGAIPYMSVSWPGMTGVASGMNLAGITVTVNAGKSGIPWAAKTPITLVTKEILENAHNIAEAIEIATKRKVFVSESIMVGSATDAKAVSIEVSPNTLDVYQSPNAGQLICTNHFQSEAYKSDKRNQKQIANSHSVYRYQKLQEILEQDHRMNPTKMAAALRSREGLNGKKMGNGNEKSINQLLAHHAVIFAPEEKIVWVSASPYQLGEFVAYDLNEIFSSGAQPHPLSKDNLNIAPDDFLHSEEYRSYEEYRTADRELDAAIENSAILPAAWLEHYQALNPDLWIVYFKTGKYYFGQKNYSLAKQNFERALTKEIPSVQEKEIVQKYLLKSSRKLH